MKKLLALAMALVLSLSLVACGGGDSSAAAGGSSTADDLSQAVEATGEKVKLGIIIWGTTDALGRNSTMMVEKLVQQAGGEIVIDSSYTSPETQIQSAENLISAGCNAILIVNSSDTMLPTLGKLCEENQVYWGLQWRDVISPEIEEQLNTMEYFVGNTCEDETEITHRLGMAMADAGVKQLAMVGNPVGDTTHDARWQGIVDACDETEMDLVAQYRYQGTSGAAACMEAVESFITGYPDLDAIFLTGGTNSTLEGALSALDKHGKRGEIKLACVDFIDADQMKEYLEDGTLFAIAGGHYVDPVFTAAMLVNAVEGNRLSDKPEEINLQFIDFQSADDAVNYYDYVENDADGVYAYTEEELGMMIKSINPDLTMDGLRQMAADYSIEDVMERHGNA